MAQYAGFNHLMIDCDDLMQYRDFFKADGRFGYAPFGIVLHTPNLDRLQARTTTFRRSAAVIPVCGPSRATIFSGYSPAETGIFSNYVTVTDALKPEQLWTYELKRAGYYMATFGKVMHVTEAGYSALPSIYYNRLYDSAPFNYTSEPTGSYTNMGGVIAGRAYPDSPQNDAAFYDAQVARDAVNFLQTYNRGRPFHLEVGFRSPHEPWHHPARIFAMVEYDKIVEPTDWPLSWDLLPFTIDEMGTGNDGGLNPGYHALSAKPPQWTAANVTLWKNSVRCYAAGILWLDEQLGRVLDALEASPHAATTIISFWSDHGYHLGDKGKFHKFDLWEEACNAVMNIGLPGQAVGQDVYAATSQIDVGPTILDYLGLPMREDRRGVSLRAYIEGNPPATPRMVPSFWYGAISGGVGQYRISAYQDGTYEFFDLAADPWAANNLAIAGNPLFEEMRELLHAMARDWGMQLVEEGATLMAGSPLASMMGYNPTVDGPVTSSFMVLGDLDARAESPNFKRMYNTNERTTNKKLHLPLGVSAFQNINTVGRIEVLGNGSDNAFMLFQGAWGDGNDTTIRTGDGDNVVDATIGVNRSRIIVHCGRGNDVIRGYGGEAHLMAGDNRLTGVGSRPWAVYDGVGDDQISTNNGTDVIHCRHGSNVVWCGGANDRVYITGGSHIVGLGGGASTVFVSRTGQPQEVSGIAGGVLDLSDWSNIGPVTLVQVGADTVITAGLERITCKATTVAVVSAAIIGAGIR